MHVFVSESLNAETVQHFLVQASNFCPTSPDKRSRSFDGTHATSCKKVLELQFHTFGRTAVQVTLNQLKHPLMLVLSCWANTLSSAADWISKCIWLGNNLLQYFINLFCFKGGRGGKWRKASVNISSNAPRKKVFSLISK